MGLFDFQGMSDQDKRMMGLTALSTGFQNLANLGARRPQVNPIEGMLNYQQTIIDNKDRDLRRQLYGEQIDAQRQKAERDRLDSAADENQARYMFKIAGLDYDKLDSQLGGFLPASSSGQSMQASPIPDIQLNPSEVQSFGQPMPQPQNMAQVAPETYGLAGDAISYNPPAKPSKLNGLLDKMGWSPEEKDYFAAQAQADPKGAAKYLQDEMKAWRKSVRGGKAATRDELAKERAIQTEIDSGSALGKRLANKQSGVNVTVPVNVMTGEAAKKAGGKEGYDIGEQAAMIENKYSAIDSIREARDILSQGIYSGYWGDMSKTIAKASMGAVGDRQRAARTEEFMSYVGNTVVPRLKEFGGNDSNEEMKYLQRIMGGDTGMEPEAISKILESAERKIARGIERLQRQRGSLEQGRMPDLGPGPSRNQPQPARQPAPASGVKKPSVSNW